MASIPQAITFHPTYVLLRSCGSDLKTLSVYQDGLITHGRPCIPLGSLPKVYRDRPAFSGVEH